MAAIDRAIALDPTPPIVGTKGQIYLKLGQPEEALVWLDRALAVDPADREHWAEKAAALRALGRDDEARAAAAQAS
jgi:Flp pilus assembly protein TadD